MLIFGVSLKVTKSSFQKRITFCRNKNNVKKVMKLVAFVFEHPLYQKKRNQEDNPHQKNVKTCNLII